MDIEIKLSKVRLIFHTFDVLLFLYFTLDYSLFWCLWHFIHHLMKSLAFCWILIQVYFSNYFHQLKQLLVSYEGLKFSDCEGHNIWFPSFSHSNHPVTPWKGASHSSSRSFPSFVLCPCVLWCSIAASAAEGKRSRRASRVSSLMAFDMPILRPPAGVSQWVARTTTPVVWRFTALGVKGLLDPTS